MTLCLIGFGIVRNRFLFAALPMAAVLFGPVKTVATQLSEQWRSTIFRAFDSDLPSDTVLALATTSDGNLWIGTDRGLARFREGKWTVFDKAHGQLPDDHVHTLATTSDGTLWVGTSPSACL